MNRRVTFFIVMLALLAVGLAACGGPKTAEISVDMSDEFRFTPDTWTVPAGAEVTVTMHNMGALEHEWVIMKLGTEVTAPFDDDDEGNIFWEAEVEPGGDGTFTFTAPTEPGTYQIVCGIAGHFEGGMIGTLVVE